MSEFINTIEVLGDDAVIDSIIERTITEFKDDVVTEVGEYAFYSCTALETVDLPNADYFARFSFTGCTALKTVNISAATMLGDSVFDGCEGIESVTAPMLVTINSKGFNDCKALKNVNFPSMEKINGSSAFAGCTALEKADFAKLNAIGSTAFHNCPAFTTLILRNTAAVATLGNVNSLPGTNYIYVPKALLDSYKAATNWSSLDEARFRAIEDYPDITGG